MIEVILPPYFNRNTIFEFINSVIDDQLHPRDDSCVVIDFSQLNFIEPFGVAVLSNTIDWLKSKGIRCQYRNADVEREAIKYLDDSEFFKNYGRGEKLSCLSCVRDTTVPLSRISHAESFEWIEFKLVPWLSRRLSVSGQSFFGIKNCIREIFNNIKDHSGEDTGCIFAQHFPNKNHVVFAISDFGVGIPRTIARIKDFDTDKDAILYACQCGVSSRSVKSNMGFGLDTLIRYVVSTNKGRLNIYSGSGKVICEFSGGSDIRRGLRIPAYYPGTFIEIIFKTDSIEDVLETEDTTDF